jgi:hypothetical protein
MAAPYRVVVLLCGDPGDHAVMVTLPFAAGTNTGVLSAAAAKFHNWPKYVAAATPDDWAE